MELRNPIASGNTADLYLWDNKMVKVYKKYVPLTLSLYEAKKQEYVYSCGLHVPKIFEVTEINNRQAIIMEYVRGKTIGELLINNEELAEHYITVLVKVQKKIHAVAVDSDVLEPMSAKLYRQIESVHNLNKKQKDILFRKLDSLIYESKLCHGDFHPFNLIMCNDEVKVIDWVDSSSGDICADVYRTYLLFSQTSVKLAEMYLSIYSKNTGLSSVEILQWAPIIAGARLAESISSENRMLLMKIVSRYCD